jgi:hypothetical protein
MKQLKRLNIKPDYSLYPMPKSGHRGISILYRKKPLYSLFIHPKHYKAKAYKRLTDALCHKYIRILKYKAKIGF